MSPVVVFHCRLPGGLVERGELTWENYEGDGLPVYPTPSRVRCGAKRICTCARRNRHTMKSPHTSKGLILVRESESMCLLPGRLAPHRALRASWVS